MTLRTRLLLAALAVFAVFIGGSVFALANQEQRLIEQVDDLLRATPWPRDNNSSSPQQQSQERPDRSPGAQDDQAPPLLDGFEEPVDGPPISDLFVATVADDGTYETIVQGQRLADLPALDALPADPPAVATLLNVPGELGISEFRVLYAPPEGSRGTSVIAMPIDDVRDAMNQLRIAFALIAVGLAAIIGLAGFWMTRYGLRPITKMTETAQAITDGDRSRRAEVPGEATEVGKMATALNVMLDERDADEARMRAFVSDASHELRTPLTSISGYLDLYQEGGFRGPGQLDDAVRRIQLEASRMNLLVGDLLLLAKFDEQQPLATDRVDATVLLGDIAASAMARQPERPIEVDAPPTGTLVVDVDRLRWHQAISVLVDNALAYTSPDTLIELSVSEADGAVEFSVADQGPGLSAHDADRIFDRFYRGDSSRARSSGGSGLGLSIARSIVEAHGGTLELQTELGHGARFSARLPDDRRID